MPEFDYRGYRIRTLYENAWKIKIWPPVKPPRLVDSAQATHAEGERTCRKRARAMVDTVIARQSISAERI